MDQKGLAVMLAIKGSAGVAPEANLNNPLHAGHKARKWEIDSGFEIQDQKSKNKGNSGPTKSTYVPKYLKKNFLTKKAKPDKN